MGGVPEKQTEPRQWPLIWLSGATREAWRTLVRLFELEPRSEAHETYSTPERSSERGELGAARNPGPTSIDCFM